MAITFGFFLAVIIKKYGIFERWNGLFNSMELLQLSEQPNNNIKSWKLWSSCTCQIELSTLDKLCTVIYNRGFYVVINQETGCFLLMCFVHVRKRVRPTERLTDDDEDHAEKLDARPQHRA